MTDLITETPSMKQILSACYSFRHDFGLLSVDEQNVLASQAMQWWRAIAKEINQPSTHPYVVDGVKADKK